MHDKSRGVFAQPVLFQPSDGGAVAEEFAQHALGWRRRRRFEFDDWVGVDRASEVGTNSRTSRTTARSFRGVRIARLPRFAFRFLWGDVRGDANRSSNFQATSVPLVIRGPVRRVVRSGGCALRTHSDGHTPSAVEDGSRFGDEHFQLVQKVFWVAVTHGGDRTYPFRRPRYRR